MRTALDLLAEDERRSGTIALARSREKRGDYNATGGLGNPGTALLQSLGITSKSGASVTENTAFNVSVFAACVNILSQSIAMLPLKIGQKTAAGSEERPDHPAAHLLKRKPGPAQTSYRWRAHKMTVACLGGNAYSRIIRDSYFRPTNIVPMIAGLVEPRLNRDSGRLYYLYQGETLQDFEVIHLRGLSSNGYTGRSPLMDMRDSMGLSMVAQEFTNRTFANGNRMPGVFEGGTTTTPEKAKEFKKFWDDNYSGAANAGRTPLLLGGISWKEAGFSNQDAELLMSRRFEVEEISRFFRVPLHLLNSTEKSTTWGTGIDSLNQGFVSYTLMPWIENWQQELEDTLLTEQEKASGYFIKFNLGVLLRGSPAARAQWYETMRRIRAMTANEIRALEDMNELSDTGANNADWPLNAQASGNAAPPVPALTNGSEE